jgi:hypothetical protein
MRRRLSLIGLALAVVVGVPVLGHLTRAWAPGACALDGVKIEPRSRVRLVAADGQEYQFCCVKCAELWLRSRKDAPRAVYVTDEATGQECDSAAASYVVGRTMTTPAGNRVHVFGSRRTAEDHAPDLQGVVLDDADRPFRFAERAAAR